MQVFKKWRPSQHPKNKNIMQTYSLKIKAIKIPFTENLTI